MGITPDEARAWHDAGLLHDALRDAQEAELRALVKDASLPTQILHGPAAAVRNNEAVHAAYLGGDTA